jgi:Bacterial regulatory proteins, luxR family
MIAGGLRNADVAQRLVVSRRTVDHHVSSILRKLDVQTRGAAAAAAADLGLLEDRQKAARPFRPCRGSDPRHGPRGHV